MSLTDLYPPCSNNKVKPKEGIIKTLQISLCETLARSHINTDTQNIHQVSLVSLLDRPTSIKLPPAILPSQRQPTQPLSHISDFTSHTRRRQRPAVPTPLTLTPPQSHIPRISRVRDPIAIASISSLRLSFESPSEETPPILFRATPPTVRTSSITPFLLPV